jgi:Rhodanese-like domain
MGIYPLYSIIRHPVELRRRLLMPVQSRSRCILRLFLFAMTACYLLGSAVTVWPAGNEPFQRITSSQLKAMLDRQEQDLVIIDTRSPGEYQEAHIRGAVNVPLPVLERSPQALIYAKGARLVFYCNGFT